MLYVIARSAPQRNAPWKLSAEPPAGESILIGTYPTDQAALERATLMAGRTGTIRYEYDRD